MKNLLEWLKEIFGGKSEDKKRLAQYEHAMKQIQSGQTDLMPSDVLAFSEPLRSSVNAMVRLGRFNLTEFTEKISFTREQTQQLANALVKRKLFEIIPTPSSDPETYYRAHLSGSTRPLTKPDLDLWKKIN